MPSFENSCIPSMIEDLCFQCRIDFRENSVHTFHLQENECLKIKMLLIVVVHDYRVDHNVLIDLTLSGPAFSVVCQAWGGGGGAQRPGCQKSKLTSTD